MGTQLPSPKKGAEPLPPIFGPFLLWPNGWMHQDATWYGGRPRPRPLCATWGPSSPEKKGHSPQFSAHVYCGQTAGWIKMPLCMAVRLGPGVIVLDGYPAPPPINADDTQLYLALSPSSYTHDISTLKSCLDSRHIWFCENGMALNASKSVVILFGTAQRLKSLCGLKSVNVAGTVIPVSDKVKVLSATLNSNLTMEPHTKTLSSFCFYHIRSLKQICSSLDDSMAGSMGGVFACFIPSSLC